MNSISRRLADFQREPAFRRPGPMILPARPQAHGIQAPDSARKRLAGRAGRSLHAGVAAKAAPGISMTPLL